MELNNVTKFHKILIKNIRLRDRVATQYSFQNSLTFNRFPDPFGRTILAIFIHRLFEDFAQIFELADLSLKKNLKP